MRWILITINISHNSWSSPHTISHFSGSQPAPETFSQYSLYLVLVWMEQFSGQTSATSTGLKRLGQHSSLAQTLLQKSATWSDVRTIFTVALYVFPLYLGRSTGLSHSSSKILWCCRPGPPLTERDPPQGLLGECLSWECRQNRSSFFSGSISDGLEKGKSGINWRCGHDLGRNLCAHWIYL